VSDALRTSREAF